MAVLTNTYYPAEGAFHGYGTQLLVVNTDVSPEEAEAVAEVKSIDFGAMTAAAFDRTHLRSPDAHTEQDVGLRSSEPITVVCNWRPKHESQGNQGAGSPASEVFQNGGMIAFYRRRETKTYRVVCTDTADGGPATELDIPGFISSYKIGTISNAGGTDVTIQISPKNGSWHAALP